MYLNENQSNLCQEEKVAKLGFENLIEVLRKKINDNTLDSELQRLVEESDSRFDDSYPKKYTQEITLSEDELRKEAEIFRDNLKQFYDFCHYELDINLDSFYHASQLQDLYSAMKNFTLKEYSKDLGSLFRYSEYDLLEEISSFMKKYLEQKSPINMKDHVKLALAVFPKDVAGRLRASGFDVTKP
jgi:hypothetical protein